MSSGSGECVLWYKTKGFKPTQIRVPRNSNIDNLRKAIKIDREQDGDETLKKIPRQEITIKTSITGEALRGDTTVETLLAKNSYDTPLIIDYPKESKTTMVPKKFFRIRVLEREDVPWAEGGVLPETIEMMVTKSEEEYWKKLERQSLQKITKAGTREQVVYEDIENEPQETWTSKENVQYDGYLDIGKLSTKYASEGVKGYHDALEAELGAWLETNSEWVVANDGLYHKDHRFQVFMKSPDDQAERERDGLILMKRRIGLISVKSPRVVARHLTRQTARR